MIMGEEEFISVVCNRNYTCVLLYFVLRTASTAEYNTVCLPPALLMYIYSDGKKNLDDRSKTNCGLGFVKNLEHF